MPSASYLHTSRYCHMPNPHPVFWNTGFHGIFWLQPVFSDQPAACSPSRYCHTMIHRQGKRPHSSSDDPFCNKYNHPYAKEGLSSHLSHDSPSSVFQSGQYTLPDQTAVHVPEVYPPLPARMTEQAEKISGPFLHFQKLLRKNPAPLSHCGQSVFHPHLPV